MDYESIIFEKEGSIATITLNRPKVLNALTYQMVQEILDAIGQVIEDEEIRVLIITGAGRAFCAGDDLRDMGTPPGGSKTDGIRQRHHLMIKAVRNLRKPVIAAVNGNAHGCGSDLMMACDFRIASEDAKMGDLRTRYAITIADGATYLLPKLVGIAKAIELIFTGDMIDAIEAERIGLVNKTVPVNKFKEEVMALAHKLAQGPTKIIGIAKAEIYRELNMDLSTALEDQLIELRTPTEDGPEGRKAFLEKRPPRYTGR